LILSFHGANRGVTGSCHLLESGGRRVLVDCGLFQGNRELEEENTGAFGFDPASIDVMLLTHAHLDHCGRLPLLVKRGFLGEIVATAATRDLTRLVLLDAARVQEEDDERRRRQTRRRGHQTGSEPLYSMFDALDTIDRFGRISEYGEALDIVPDIRAVFHDAGHILGSAGILVEATENGRRRRILFSGDLGNAGRPLLAAPSPPASADIIVMESTYGDRSHRPYADSVEEMYDAITETFARGGNVLIPSFSLERAQEILYVLREGIEQNRLPPSMAVFLDSPLAIAATEVFKRHPGYYGVAVARLIAKGIDPFGFSNLHLTREPAESMAINRISGGAVIIAGSGMCTGGRIRHHLRQNLWRSEASVVFVGFAANGTLARRIVDGARSVEILGDDVAVRARIHTINGFSAHADQQELIDWHNGVAGTETTFLVHGEPAAMTALGSGLTRGRVSVPELHQAFPI